MRPFNAVTIWRYRPDVRLTYRAPEFEMQIRTNDVGLREGPIAPDAEGIRTVLRLRSKYATPQKSLTDAAKYVDSSYLETAATKR